MTSNDVLHRFIFDHCDVRGEVATLSESYRTMLSHHSYPPAIENLLGEFLAAVSLLSSTLKFEGTMILQARGDGPIATIMAECSNHKNLRGIVRLNPNVELTEELATNGGLHQLLGQGVLVITVEPKRTTNFGGKVERYQGIVPMEADNLAGCLEIYFQQSEQLATRIWLAADGKRASGFMIQALPKQLVTDEDENKKHWTTITALAETLTPDELLSVDHETLLYRLFHEESVRVYDPSSLTFVCSCSRERTADALMSLGKEDVEALLVEQGDITIDCQFCNKHYVFKAEEVRKLIGGDVLH